MTAAQRVAIETGRRALRAYGMATAAWRPDPEFLVIGAKRGGSTSFYFDLVEHTHISPLFPRPDHLPKVTVTKGTHYFDQNYARGERWYRSHLPSTPVRRRLATRVGSPVITGEASPYYLFHPGAAERAALLLPDVKIIAVLRDPVLRAYSHWKERRRSNAELLSFPDAIAAESARIGTVSERLRTDPGAQSYAHEQQSYVQQSEYADALVAWYENFPRNQLHIVASEDYYADPATVLADTQHFLGLPVERLGSGEVRNAAEGAEIDPGVRAELTERFAPGIVRLAELTGRTFPWR